MARTVIKNTGKDPIEITLEIDGVQKRTIINRGRIELPLGAKLVSQNPNVKVVEDKNSVQEPEKVVVKNKVYGNSNQKVS